MHYYMFHKPFGCVSARRDDLYPTVMDYFAFLSDILSTLPEEIQQDIHKNRPEHPVTYGKITICEGKKRQIRRMMKSVHCCVIELKRISIGEIVLDETLQSGEWKEIFPYT